jgi:hypothetical protein
MRMPQSEDPAIHEQKHAVILRIRLVIGSVWSANATMKPHCGFG